MENAQQIAQTIQAQLGGGRFAIMTGAKNFSYDNKGALSFKIGRNGSGFNYVKVELNSLDLYDMTFMKVTLKKGVIKEDSVSNIYNDQLRDIFESKTGLYTSL